MKGQEESLVPLLLAMIFMRSAGTRVFSSSSVLSPFTPLATTKSKSKVSFPHLTLRGTVPLMMILGVTTTVHRVLNEVDLRCFLHEVQESLFVCSRCRTPLETFRFIVIHFIYLESTIPHRASFDRSRWGSNVMSTYRIYMLW